MRSIRDFGREGSKSDSSSTLREDVQSVAAKYAGRSEEELLRALKQNVAAAKRNGTFSAEQLDSFVSVVSSSLDEQSRQRLISLVEMIKAE
ncbi:MAG: hypothetical protein K2O39_00375 [Clostridiales bacterium]|nr:hypothetical protein [Clostridiales bacterium]